MAVVVAIDAGTTGVRALAFDELGQVVAGHYQEFPQHFPRAGWVEHDPDDIWAAVHATLTALTAEIDARELDPIACVGITNQRETAVAWRRSTGRPAHRAIVWQDRRTAGACDDLRADASTLATVREATGLVLDPYFSATKWAWMLDPAGGGLTSAADLALGTVDSWLLWNLTGGAPDAVHATEPSNASRTLLYDIRRLEWSSALCDLFGVPASCLPEVRPSTATFGQTVEGSGLPSGIPICGIAGDQQASLFGQACFAPGATKNTYGTGSFVLLNVGGSCPDPQEGLLTTVGWVLADGTTAYALEGAIFVTGAAVQWMRDNLRLIANAAEIEALAGSVEDSAGLYLVPAFAGLGSPYWDAHARGLLIGVGTGTTRAHLARAVLEAMAFQTRDVIRQMNAVGAVAGATVTELRVDGGASANRLMLQLQADQLQLPVRRSSVQETTALGAAFLAGLGAGLWASPDEVAATWRCDAEFRPQRSPAAADRRYAGWLRAVERSRTAARG